jgi:hypothetical protein
MNDEDIERSLREAALRPEDEAFTHRILAALPPPVHRFRAELRRSFELASRFGLSLVVLAVAVRWYSAGPGGLDAVLVILLFAVPAFAALSWLCGPLVPRSAWRFFWRPAPNWR